MVRRPIFPVGYIPSKYVVFSGMISCEIINMRRYCTKKLRFPTMRIKRQPKYILMHLLVSEKIEPSEFIVNIAFSCIYL